MAKKVTTPAAGNAPARDSIALNTISANCDAKNEIIVYQPSGGEFHIEVRVDDETVWLTQAQMAELFYATKQNVSLHIANIFNEGELDSSMVVKESLTTTRHGAIQGKSQTKKVKIYSLDVIISVGYRVKSIQGTRFRQWANQVLKDHLLRGASVNHRFLLMEERVDQQLVNHENHLRNLDFRNDVLDNRLGTLEKQVDFFVKANLPPNEGILNAKSWWSGYELAVQLVRSAKEEVVVIDPFADDMALSLIAKKAEGVRAIVYSACISRVMNDEAARLNRQFPDVELRNMRDVHDRFIIVDDKIYHIGTSIRDLGNRLTAFSVLSAITKEQLLAIVK